MGCEWQFFNRNVHTGGRENHFNTRSIRGKVGDVSRISRVHMCASIYVGGKSTKNGPVCRIVWVWPLQ